jgi:quinohemoprotein ethanol dehydrogenase
MAVWSRILLAGSALALLAACGPKDTPPPPEGKGFAAVDTARIETASAGAEWLTYGGTYDEQRHSSLDAVNKDNVDQLGVAWTFDLATNRGVEVTPIVVDGVMFVTSAWSVVYALGRKDGRAALGT